MSGRKKKVRGWSRITRKHYVTNKVCRYMSLLIKAGPCVNDPMVEEAWKEAEAAMLRFKILPAWTAIHEKA